MADVPSISVVIPTVGRAELFRAVASVRSQTYRGQTEVIVVLDAVESEGEGDLVDKIRTVADQLIFGGGLGGGNARNLGVRAAHGKLIAFLDDDDTWSVEKLERQVELLASAARRDSNRAVASSRVRHVDATSGRSVGGVPARVIRRDDRVAEYLFRGRRPSVRRASLYTSTLLASRQLCIDVPWDSSLRRHQDWDWLLRLEREASAYFLQHEEELVTIQVGSHGSISAKADWKASLDWAHRALSDDPRVRSDFLTAQTLRYALNGRDATGVHESIDSIRQTRRLPSFGPLVIALSGLASRRAIEWAMTLGGERQTDG